jgi:hypothetical protein
MIALSLKDTGAFLGTIEEADLQLLLDQLEEEDEDDTDYYITPVTIDYLERGGGSLELIRILREAVGDTEGVEVAWTAEDVDG